jgi:hypothetical protein
VGRPMFSKRGLESGVSDTHQSLDSCLASQQSHPPSD